jgi:hypothetical protein
MEKKWHLVNGKLLEAQTQSEENISVLPNFRVAFLICTQKKCPLVNDKQGKIGCSHNTIRAKNVLLSKLLKNLNLNLYSQQRVLS